MPWLAAKQQTAWENLRVLVWLAAKQLAAWGKPKGSNMARLAVKQLIAWEVEHCLAGSKTADRPGKP